MNIVWSPLAQSNLWDIYSYYSDRNTGAAERLLAMIYKSAEALREYPNLGPLNNHKTCRLLQVPGTAYVLPYRVLAEAIEILAVFDQRQDRPDYLQ